VGRKITQPRSYWDRLKASQRCRPHNLLLVLRRLLPLVNCAHTIRTTDVTRSFISGVYKINVFTAGGYALRRSKRLVVRRVCVPYGLCWCTAGIGVRVRIETSLRSVHPEGTTIIRPRCGALLTRSLVATQLSGLPPILEKEAKAGVESNHPAVSSSDSIGLVARLWSRPVFVDTSV
jgi:hypothetical protein